MKPIKFTLLFLVLAIFMAGCGTKNTEQTVQKTNGESGLIVKEGVFSGLADSHTIEIMVNKKPIDLQVHNKLQSKVNSLDEGDSVHFKYSVNKTTKQNELLEINRIK